ncbi:hypothetical protein BUALT_Bualt01G0172200 [Buddleja alternifolia]|uniref:Bifunctional inhibitor/plant lipid transfer protein/seed storage helical domain-containing protein n=1 Tax=Buddleja alternifolia TaxID=168488 RepID=A0AAV6Y7Z5_9LAMI|nr:hypothetical protein BUALT_Bualt01G0172200 [Buddleja alternifolia]
MKLPESKTRPFLMIMLVMASVLVQESGAHPCGSTFFSALVQLIPCRASVMPFSPIPPSESCCASIKALGQPCLCVLVNGPPISGVDRSMALQLPEKCTANFEPCADAAVFTMQNRCNKTIWPGILSSAGRPQLMNTGFQLNPNQKTDIVAPTGWSGRIWARSGCFFDQSTKQGNCTTGDCGGRLECSGAGGAPPASLAEFTLDSPEDFYDVSLVDGFNLPISIVPSGGSGNCSPVYCNTDFNQGCPEKLQVRLDNGETVACKSACMAFNESEYCCTGEYNSPQHGYGSVQPANSEKRDCIFGAKCVRFRVSD